MVPPKPEITRGNKIRFMDILRPYQLTKPYLKNNYVFILFLSVFILINSVLFLSRLYEYRHSNCFTMVARACGKLYSNCITITLYFYVYPSMYIQDNTNLI